MTDETVEQEAGDMAALVHRDRSHPSVILWSFCNEVGCNNESAAALFRAVRHREHTPREEWAGMNPAASCVTQLAPGFWPLPPSALP